MPLVATRGAASAQGFGEFAQSAAPVYIEDVFSTWLYTGNGNGTTGGQSINNGIDLSTKGGLIWTKSRSDGSQHQWCDTARGINKFLRSEVTNGQYTSSSNTLTSFNSNGYTMGADSTGNINYTGINYASWTFRKQAKFFDVVTWTGDGNASKTISHSLGSVPGCIITKSSSGVNNWQTYHRSLGNTQAVQLNLTNAASTNSGFWNNTSPTSTEFTVGTVENASGETYVAYLFAHNAGGFGLTGTDNVISCGSFTGGNGSNAETNLGYEPQWVLVKRATGGTSSWTIYDNMRGVPTPGGTVYARVLYPDLSNAEEDSGGNSLWFTSTGFRQNFINDTWIYIAIRRGPMKTPTSGTSVFIPITNNNGTGTQNTTNFPVDMQINTLRQGDGRYVVDRLRGVSTNSTAQANSLQTNNTDPEHPSNLRSLFWNNTGFQTPAYYGGSPAFTALYYNFQRAPGFFDVVCYTGQSGNTIANHNLGVQPTLIITKQRNGSSFSQWVVSVKPDPVVNSWISGNLYTTAAFSAPAALDFAATSTYIVADYIGGAGNNTSTTYVSYLFATVAGVSKVGSYTGTGALQTINCGFTGGARFVLIKRTDSTGDWFTYDSARGISSGNDPYLFLNSTAAEVTGTNYVDTTSVGFQVTAAAPAGLNANGGTYIFLAIA